MKVVLFCGGQGLRLREHSEKIPKPMVPIGLRPVIWHLMRYYSHYGHTEFILCLGHQAEAIKRYFLQYEETLTNDFVLESDGSVRLLRSDTEGWRITFADTGLQSNIGQRLMRIREHIGDDQTFLANYADVVTDAPLDQLVAGHQENGAIATFLSVQPNYSFHVVRNEPAAAGLGRVTDIGDVRTSGTWINGGYFVLDRAIFDHIGPGEELVVEPFQRLIEQGRLYTREHRGFWAPMDTLKEKMMLDSMHDEGVRPWCVWEREDDAS